MGSGKGPGDRRVEELGAREGKLLADDLLTGDWPFVATTWQCFNRDLLED